MSTDKLSIINAALARTGNRPVTTEGEATDEWVMASIAYDDEMALLLSDHDWGFAGRILTLERIGTSVDQNWTDAFRKPPECLHVEAVYDSTDRPIDFDILDNQVLANASIVRAKIIRRPTPESWPPFFIEALKQRIMVHLFSGLNEDMTEAGRMRQLAEQTLDRARARTDQEKPRRTFLRSGLQASRRVRLGGGGYDRGST